MSETLNRVSTGNAEADAILHGGFPANSINILMGLPGTGKTIFAEQLVFHNAKQPGQRPILYVTTVSEPMDKMVRYLQQFDFYDPKLIGSKVLIEDLGGALAEEGPNALYDYLEARLPECSPTIVVVDSFKALNDLWTSRDSLRPLWFRLMGLLTAYECTSFLLGEYSEEEARRLPEFAIADSIVSFYREPTSNRDARFMRVSKLRGSGYLEGIHAFRIRPDGIHFYPRLVSPEMPQKYQFSKERIATGTPGLDAYLEGGLWRGSTTLLIGPTGSGKTTMGLQFLLEGLRCGEKCLHVNFQENPTQLARSVHGLGANLDELKEKGLTLVYTSPVEMQIDSLVGTIFKQVSEGEIGRVVIDAVGDLKAAADSHQRLYDFLYALTQHFSARDVTSMLCYEIPEAPLRISSMCDNVLQLGMEFADGAARSLRVIKTRGSSHDLALRQMVIGSGGVRVL